MKTFWLENGNEWTLSSVVQPPGSSHRCPGPSHWHPGSSVWRPRWSLGPPGWGVIISGSSNSWLCSWLGMGIGNSHTLVHPSLQQSPHGHEINQRSLVDSCWHWWEKRTAADTRQNGWVLSCRWRIPCWSSMGCWAVQCQGLKVCWAGHTCRVVIMKCWAVCCWLLTCWVGNFFWTIHNDWLVISCWPVVCWPIICWAVTCRVVTCWAVTCRAVICWPVHNLCRTRHCCWVVHFSCRFFHVFWPGRWRNHCYGSLLWWLGNGRGQLYFPSGDVWWTRPPSTLSSSLLMMTRLRLAIGRRPRWRWRQGPAITRRLVMMVMGMRGRGWRPGVRRPGNTAGPWTTSRIRLSPGAGPARRRGSGPLTLSPSTGVSRRMMSGGVLASVWPVRSSLAIPNSWSVAFWPIGAGPSHHRHTGSHRLLGFTGPGRPDGRLLHLRSLRPRTCGCLGLLGLGRPFAGTHGRKLKDLFWSMYLNWVVHRLTLLGLLCRFRRLTSALLFVGFCLRLPGLRQPILTDLKGQIFCTQSEPLV